MTIAQSYDTETDTYSSSEEQVALTDPGGAVEVPAVFQLARGSLQALPRVAEAFGSGEGIGWHERRL